MKAARLKEIGQLLVNTFGLDEIETAIAKASDSKGLEYCVLVPNQSE